MISISTPGTSRAKRQPNAWSAPSISTAASSSGMMACAAPPPALPQPAAAALAVPTTLGANITEVWYCVITKLAPTAPISRRKVRKVS
jgi:hypothetical protein